MFRPFFAIAVIIFSFCTASPVTAQISPSSQVTEEAIQFNADLLNDMLKRDVDAVIEKSLDEVKAIDDFEATLNKSLSYLPVYEEGKTYKVLAKVVRQTTDTDTPELIYKTQYELTNLNLPETLTAEWALIDIYSQETADGLKFRHFNFQPVPLQPSTIGDFGLKNKSVIHYVFLGLLVLVPLFIIFTVLAIMRNKHMTKKWLWGLFSSVGLWGFNLNWTTGKISTEFVDITANSVHFQILSFQLLGAAIVKQATYSPYIITIAFPIGAILYWILKHRDKSVPTIFE